MSEWSEAIIAWASVFAVLALVRIGTKLSGIIDELRWTREHMESESKLLDALRECRGENIRLRKELEAAPPQEQR